MSETKINPVITYWHDENALLQRIVALLTLAIQGDFEFHVRHDIYNNFYLVEWGDKEEGKWERKSEEILRHNYVFGAKQNEPRG